MDFNWFICSYQLFSYEQKREIYCITLNTTYCNHVIEPVSVMQSGFMASEIVKQYKWRHARTEGETVGHGCPHRESDGSSASPRPFCRCCISGIV